MSRLFRHRRKSILSLAFGAVLLGGFSLELMPAPGKQARAFGVVQPANRDLAQKRWASVRERGESLTAFRQTEHQQS